MKEVIAHTGEDIGWHHMDDMMGWWGPMDFGWIGFIFSLLFWIVIIAGIVMLVKSANKGGTNTQHGTAMQILEERYAKGDIDKEEFEAKKRDLNS